MPLQGLVVGVPDCYQNMGIAGHLVALVVEDSAHDREKFVFRRHLVDVEFRGGVGRLDVDRGLDGPDGLAD